MSAVRDSTEYYHSWVRGGGGGGEPYLTKAYRPGGRGDASVTLSHAAPLADTVPDTCDHEQFTFGYASVQTFLVQLCKKYKYGINGTTLPLSCVIPFMSLTHY